MIEFSKYCDIINKAKSLYVNHNTKPWTVKELGKYKGLFDGIEEPYLSIIFTTTMLMLEYNDTSQLEKVYKSISELKSSTLDKVIDSGYQGIIFDLGDKILKYFPEGFRKKDKIFYNYCRQNHIKEFPIIYRMGKNYIVEEKLQIAHGHIDIPTKILYPFLRNINGAFREMFGEIFDIDLTPTNMGKRSDGQLVIFDI